MCGGISDAERPFLTRGVDDRLFFSVRSKGCERRKENEGRNCYLLMILKFCIPPHPLLPGKMSAMAVVSDLITRCALHTHRERVKIVFCSSRGSAAAVATEAAASTAPFRADSGECDLSAKRNGARGRCFGPDTTLVSIIIRTLGGERGLIMSRRDKKNTPFLYGAETCKCSPIFNDTQGIAVRPISFSRDSFVAL